MKKLIVGTAILCGIVFIVGLYAFFFVHGIDPNFDIDGAFITLICLTILKYLLIALVIMIIVGLLLKKI